MNRRTLLAASTLLPLGLAACKTNPNAPTVTPAALASAILAGLQSVVAAVSAVPGVPADLVAQIQGYLATIKTDANTIIAAVQSATTPTITIQSLATAVDMLLPLLAPFAPHVAGLQPVLDAAVAAVQAILALAGISAAKASAYAVGHTYTPSQAIAVLNTGV